MKTVNAYIKYVYILLGIALIGVIIALLIHLGKMMKTLAQTAQKTENITRNLEADKEKISFIRNSKDSWSFFLSLYVVAVVLKEALQNRKREDSFIKSLTYSGKKHAKQLSKIRF